MNTIVKHPGELAMQNVWGIDSAEPFDLRKVEAAAKAWAKEQEARSRLQIQAALAVAKNSGDDVRMKDLRERILAGKK